MDPLQSDLRRVMTVARAFPHTGRAQVCFLFAWQLAEIPEKERIRLMFSAEVEACLGPTYFGAFVPCSERCYVRYHHTEQQLRPTHADKIPRAFMINAFPQFLPTANEPDKEVIYLRHHHLIHRIAIADLIDRCYHLHRLMGCDTCPRVGYRCLLDHHGDGPNQTWRKDRKQLYFAFLDQFKLPEPEKFDAKWFDLDDWRDLRLKNWKSQFARYTVVPSLATAYNPTQPGTPAFRVPFEHNFFHIEDVQEELSSRAREGVQTRKTRREQCTKCYFGGTSTFRGHTTNHTCSKYAPRWCKHGAWTEEEVVRCTLEYVDAALSKSSFTLDDLWLVANVAGIEFHKKNPETNRNREWVISRLETVGEAQRPVVVARRTCKGCWYETVELTSADEVYAFLSKGTRLVWDEAKTKPRDDGQLALWLHLACLRFGKSYSFYWSSQKSGDCGFGCCAPMVGSVSLHSYGARVQLWLSKEKRNVHLGDFQEMYNRYERLPLFNIYKPWKEEKQHPVLHAHA